MGHGDNFAAHIVEADYIVAVLDWYCDGLVEIDEPTDSEIDYDDSYPLLLSDDDGDVVAVAAAID